MPLKTSSQVVDESPVYWSAVVHFISALLQRKGQIINQPQNSAALQSSVSKVLYPLCSDVAMMMVARQQS